MIRKSVQRFSLRQTRSVCAEIMRNQESSRVRQVAEACKSALAHL
jgi:hypothetical protein